MPISPAQPHAISCVAEANADTRVLSPTELQVKSLAAQGTRLNQQAKLITTRTKVTNAQDKLSRARAASKLSYITSPT
jgi:DNA-binding CsgD family transcriptional regulator